MTLPTFPPTGAPNPAFPLDKPVEPAVISNEFGDGYNQESADGINHLRTKVSVMWPDGLTETEKNLIEAFFVERGGYQPFLWTFPGDEDPSKWKCRPWAVKLTGPRSWGITATFIRDYTP